MNRIYHRYELWEDYKAGMYETKISNAMFFELAEKSRKLLSNPDEFFNVAISVLNNWKFASDENLSNKSCNRRAWIGQSACCYKYSSPEICTREAWSKMTVTEQYLADKIADKIIKLYEDKNRKVHQGLGNEMLF